MVDRFMRRVSIAGDAPFTIPENSILRAKERSEEQIELGPEISAEGLAPDDDVAKQHRLQRQKFQSRKTFRFRKSRKGNLEFSSVDLEEVPTLETPSQSGSPTPGDQLLKDADKKEKDDEEKLIDGSKHKTSLRIRSKKRNKSTSPQNGGDGESQNSFSRTSSTCGYRESFGSVERHSLQMLERLEVEVIDGEKETVTGMLTKKRATKAGEDDEDTLI